MDSETKPPTGYLPDLGPTNDISAMERAYGALKSSAAPHAAPREGEPTDDATMWDRLLSALYATEHTDDAARVSRMVDEYRARVEAHAHDAPDQPDEDAFAPWTIHDGMEEAITARLAVVARLKPGERYTRDDIVAEMEARRDIRRQNAELRAQVASQRAALDAAGEAVVLSFDNDALKEAMEDAMRLQWIAEHGVSVSNGYAADGSPTFPGTHARVMLVDTELPVIPRESPDWLRAALDAARASHPEARDGE